MIESEIPEDISVSSVLTYALLTYKINVCRSSAHPYNIHFGTLASHFHCSCYITIDTLPIDLSTHVHFVTTLID